MRRPGRVALAAVACCLLAACRPTDDGPPTAVPSATPVASPSAVPSPTPTPSPTSPSSSPSPAAGAPADSTVVGRFPADVGDEVSGVVIAAGGDAVWLVDDEAGTTLLHLVALEGTALGSLRLDGATTRNPEDLATGPCPDDATVRCLWVADVGDNLAARDEGVQLLAVPEPAVATLSPDAPLAVTPTVRRLTYDDGPVDAEAAVVTTDGTVVVVDKTPRAPGVHVAAPGAATLTRVGELELPLPDPPLLSLFTDVVVTGADLAPDGLVLRTYDQVLRVRVDLSEPTAPSAWAAATIDQRRAPVEPQGEAVALLDDGRVLTVSEQSTAITVTVDATP